MQHKNSNPLFVFVFVFCFVFNNSQTQTYAKPNSERPSLEISALDLPTTDDILTDIAIDTDTAIALSILASYSTPTKTIAVTKKSERPTRVVKTKTKVFTVPFYSQFTDISSAKWQKVGCGIASLAMLIEYYEPDSVSVDTLLTEGIAAGAFLADAGWTHSGLINLAKKYGLTGSSHDMAESSMATAFTKLEAVLKEGPVMVSVHYTFDPQNPIPHLVVLSGIRNGQVYYNDPAEKTAGGSLSISKFQKAWKKRYIEIRSVS